MNLTAENVHKTFIGCLFKDDESTENHTAAKGIMTSAGFHPGRLQESKTIIREMLNELSNDFKRSGGGGTSFLNMSNDKNENQWTDLHQTMDELVMLGVATGMMSFLMSRDMWCFLPGSMPYLVVND